MVGFINRLNFGLAGLIDNQLSFGGFCAFGVFVMVRAGSDSGDMLRAFGIASGATERGGFGFFGPIRHGCFLSCLE